MMLLDLTVREFLEELGSDSAVPGGGSASALRKRPGSLVQMVARISTRKEENPHLKGAQEKAAALTDRLSDLIQRDADAFAKVMQAFRLPKGLLRRRPPAPEQSRQRTTKLRLSP